MDLAWLFIVLIFTKIQVKLIEALKKIACWQDRIIN